MAGVLAGVMVELPPPRSTFGCNNQLTYSTVNGTNPQNYTYSGNFSIAGSSGLAVRYDMYGNPDRLRLYESNGTQVFDSGYAGTRSAAQTSIILEQHLVTMLTTLACRIYLCITGYLSPATTRFIPVCQDYTLAAT